MDAKEKAADKRLQKKFFVGLDYYETRLAEQDGKCKICKQPPGKIRLSIDHDHRFDRVKILVRKTDFGTYSAAAYEPALGIDMIETGVLTRKEARRRIKERIVRRSIRGLLCWRCNSGLQKFSDTPSRFAAAAKYLTEFLETTPHEFRS